MSEEEQLRLQKEKETSTNAFSEGAQLKNQNTGFDLCVCYSSLHC